MGHATTTPPDFRCGRCETPYLGATDRECPQCGSKLLHRMTPVADSALPLKALLRKRIMRRHGTVRATRENELAERDLNKPKRKLNPTARGEAS